MTEPCRFRDAFCALSKHTPFPWQERLYDRFNRGEFPLTFSLPTGMGKTSVIAVWLLALAEQPAEVEPAKRVPRRLAYVVNRRTVVDQATDVVEQMRERLRNPRDERWSRFGATLDGLANRLRELSACDGKDFPFAVSTLRGELADNEEWKADPARPAIIIGTIDMIGSKLLFSGYGDGRYGRAHHAGLIGQDALIVHDEAHLSPAFDALLDAVMQEQERTKEARRIRVIRLSATARGIVDDGAAGAAPFGIEDADRDHQVVKERLWACKRLEILEAERDKVLATIAAKALELDRDGARVLVYVRSPETAQAVREKIIKGLKQRAEDAEFTLTDEEAMHRVGLLTGTIRGHERDQLAKSDLLRVFQSKAVRGATGQASGGESCFLVSTSAGEVGADWDADHLVCDMTTLDSMIQRFGRVNRLGGDRRLAQVVVVTEVADARTEKSASYDAAILKTREILRKIADGGGDVSPAGLGAAVNSLSDEAKRAAFSPAPTILPATDILFDAWSLTSIAGGFPGRAEVGPYLHGVAEWEPPETHVAWRADIAELARAGGKDDDGKYRPCSQDDLGEVFDAFPLRSIETLRDRTNRVLGELQKLAKRHPEQLVVVIRNRETRWMKLADLAPENADKKRIAASPIAYATIVLPTDIGGLQDGTLNGDAQPPVDPHKPEKHRTLDVAEKAVGGMVDRQRVVVGGSNGEGQDEPILGGVVLDHVARHSVALSSGDDDEGGMPQAIEYRVAKGEEREPGQRIPLGEHNKAVAAAAERIANALGLSAELVQAVKMAGQWHDIGKNRELWQRYARNLLHRETPGGAIAKSDRYGHWKTLGGYRHEFGSLLEAMLEENIAKHPERDLILHLIAAHHGWARPHFEARAFDHEGPLDPSTGDRRAPTSAENEQASVEVMQRFGRLQQRFGRWGLAWLESLLRSADIAASKQAIASPDAAIGSRQLVSEEVEA